jgi:phosphoheptose isomerase
VYKTYDTDLISASNAQALAALMGQRFSIMRQRLKTALGIDTSIIELLDTVYTDMTINGRTFSKAQRFIVTEINPAQDILTLEEA